MTKSKEKKIQVEASAYLVQNGTYGDFNYHNTEKQAVDEAQTLAEGLIEDNGSDEETVTIYKAIKVVRGKRAKANFETLEADKVKFV